MSDFKKADFICHTPESNHVKVQNKHLPVEPVNGWWITPMTGLPSTATHTIVVTYFTRFSIERERPGVPEEEQSWEERWSKIGE